MKASIRSLLLASSILGSALCASAYGETPTAAAPTAQGGSAPTSIGEVIVTARRIQERLQDVPISVTVYSQQQLANKNIVNMGDLALYTPSLGMTNVLSNDQ